MKCKYFFLLLLFCLLAPTSISAYSNRIAIGGDTIGIEVHSDGVYIVGFYKVHDKNIASNAGFEVGDIIVGIDSVETSSIASLNPVLTESREYQFHILRDGKNQMISFQPEWEDGVLKTGLYVKDSINGIGTLSYVDPNTKIYGSLGHEILESSSLQKFQLLNGSIYKAEVSSIKKSQDGVTGEKNAVIDKSSPVGSIFLNEVDGIFGSYKKDISHMEILDVAMPSEIVMGDASIRTVLSNHDIQDYSIEIIGIDEGDFTKNILFEIVDPKLLSKAGGIIQGMSGSPILQDHKIIGVVNYVIVDESNKGYGIFITTMLEEGDKILS